MKFNRNSYWRTRGGQIAHITAISEPNFLWGHVETYKGNTPMKTFRCWNFDGTYYRPEDPHQNDLVTEHYPDLAAGCYYCCE